MIKITKEEITEALNLADQALVDIPNFPGIVTSEMIVNLAGSILITNEISRATVYLSHKENPFIPEEYSRCLESRFVKCRIKHLKSEPVWDTCHSGNSAHENIPEKARVMDSCNTGAEAAIKYR